MLLVLTLLSVLSFSETIKTQESGNTSLNEWKGLVLNQSTPAEAIKLFGEPSTREMQTLKNGKYIEQWLTEDTLKIKSKSGQDVRGTYVWMEGPCESLIYINKIEGYQSVELQFFKGKLIEIYLQFTINKELTIREISTEYRIRLYPMYDLSPKETVSNFSPTEFVQYHEDIIRQNRILPANKADYYTLVGVTNESFVVCRALTLRNHRLGIGLVTSYKNASNCALISRRVEKPTRANQLLR